MANKTLIAAAGEHYVAYALSCLGFTAALVRQGAPSIDILASTLDGGRTIGIQVKTTEWAERTRGRGEEKKPFELQFPLGHRAIEQASPNTVVCFVDLRGLDFNEQPNVYVVTTRTLIEQYRGKDIRQYSYFRYHRPIEEMDKFKNNWQPIIEALS